MIVVLSPAPWPHRCCYYPFVFKQNKFQNNGTRKANKRLCVRQDDRAYVCVYRFAVWSPMTQWSLNNSKGLETLKTITVMCTWLTSLKIFKYQKSFPSVFLIFNVYLYYNSTVKRGNLYISVRTKIVHRFYFPFDFARRILLNKISQDLDVLGKSSLFKFQKFKKPFNRHINHQVCTIIII